ncbi:hypothetical protein Mgra_00009117 [Meloidogyne graminicola]|uniref:Uncharacterized protein n=1 Tax=Meloidogyne graminicola TaxID=189291 RepID=A0A8S9ZDW2_9BILA|nr:hypothetical protein Mgra_00009117 [Meloidogyne graminicola]
MKYQKNVDVMELVIIQILYVFKAVLNNQNVYVWKDLFVMKIMIVLKRINVQNNLK